MGGIGHSIAAMPTIIHPLMTITLDYGSHYAITLGPIYWNAHYLMLGIDNIP
jgi:hypothetical protein